MSVEKRLAQRDRNFPTIDSELINRVRNKFVQHYETHKDDFEEKDLMMIKEDDWNVYRFVNYHNGNEDKAYDQLAKSFEWRKKMALRSTEANFFPDLIWRLGPLFIYENDRKGRPTIYSRCKFVLCIKEIAEFERLFTAYQIWSIDMLANGKGWSLILDFAETGLKNTDFDLLKFFLNLLMVQFPRGIDNILVINLPFILRLFWGLVKTWIPSDRIDLIKFVDQTSIQEHIQPENLPNFLGGTCQRPYKGMNVVPKGCPDVFEFGEKIAHISRKRCEEIYKIFEPLILEEIDL